MFKVSGMILTDFLGGATSGPVSVPGLKVGDRVIHASSGSTDYDGYFEKVISVDDEVQQLIPADISSVTVELLVYRI